MPILTPGRIRHSVVFTLKHEAGSDAESDFVAAITALERIPGVEAFELMREISPKNDFDYGLTMEFADESAYTAYNEHPQHVSFVADRWDTEVTSFLEIDTVAR
jgi:heme-degrading monooxygenase HmoA